MEEQIFNKKCINHNDNNFNFYCFDDKQFLCDECFKAHKKHNIEVKSELIKYNNIFQNLKGDKSIKTCLEEIKSTSTDIISKIKLEIIDKINPVLENLNNLNTPNKVNNSIFDLNSKEFESLEEFKNISNSLKNITEKFQELSFKYSMRNCNDSIILEYSQNKDKYVEILKEWTNCNNMKLLFRGTKDGMTAQAFHSKCDNRGKTIVLIKNDKGNIFGGFASIPWTNNTGSYFSAPDSFIFTLTNIYNIKPIKFENKKDGKEVCHNKDYGPLFGNSCDIYISKDFINGVTKSSFPSSYIDSLGKGCSIFTGNSDNSNKNFKIKEIEVFEVI